MRMKNQEKRVLNILLDLYTLTKDEHVHLSAYTMRKSYDLGYVYSDIILENLFLKTTDERDKRIHLYKWKTIKPNIHMARKVCEEARAYFSQKRKDREAKAKNVSNNTKIKNRKVTENVVKNDNHNVSNKTISFFWGLLKISINK